MEWIEETLKVNKTERPLIYQKNADKEKKQSDIT